MSAGGKCFDALKRSLGLKSELWSGSMIFSIENFRKQPERWFFVWLISESLVSWSTLDGDADGEDVVVIFRSSESELIAFIWSLFADSIVGLLGVFEFNPGRSGVTLHICIPRGLCDWKKNGKISQTIGASTNTAWRLVTSEAAVIENDLKALFPRTFL